MCKRFVFIVLIAACSLVFTFHAHAAGKPPRPGKYYIWIPPLNLKNGRIVPGHWKYQPPPRRQKVWIPGRREANGQWVPGHYKYVIPPSADAVWVPGFHSPKGKWIRGYWQMEDIEDQ